MGWLRWCTIRGRRGRRVTYGWPRNFWGGIWRRLEKRRLRRSAPEFYIDIHRYNYIDVYRYMKAVRSRALTQGDTEVHGGRSDDYSGGEGGGSGEERGEGGEAKGFGAWAGVVVAGA